MQKLQLGAEYNPDDQTAEPVQAATSASYQPIMGTTPTQGVTGNRTTTMSRTTSRLPLIIAVVAIAAGALTGFGAFTLQAKGGTLAGGSPQPIQQVADADNINNGDVFGSTEAGAFKDSAEGYLEIGGLDGEGSHKLLRAGGDSQTVYLVSTVTELDRFDGMNVKVWGETYKGQKAGWLMDVGRVQIVNAQGTNPNQE